MDSPLLEKVGDQCKTRKQFPPTAENWLAPLRKWAGDYPTREQWTFAPSLRHSAVGVEKSKWSLVISFQNFLEPTFSREQSVPTPPSRAEACLLEKWMTKGSENHIVMYVYQV